MRVWGCTPFGRAAVSVTAAGGLFSVLGSVRYLLCESVARMNSVSQPAVGAAMPVNHGGCCSGFQQPSRVQESCSGLGRLGGSGSA